MRTKYFILAFFLRGGEPCLGGRAERSHPAGSPGSSTPQAPSSSTTPEQVPPAITEEGTEGIPKTLHVETETEIRPDRFIALAHRP